MTEESKGEKRLVPHRIPHRFPDDGPVPPWLIRGIRADVTFVDKIIFLNDANLEILKGYKAAIEVRSGLQNTFTIAILATGFSRKAAFRLFDQVKEMDIDGVLDYSLEVGQVPTIKIPDFWFKK